MTMWNVTHSGAWIMDRYPGIPGVLSFPDSLTTGPIEDTGDVDAWFERRSRYWRELRTVLSGAGSAQDSELSAEELRTAADSDALTFWLGAGTSDHLFAGWLIASLARMGASPKLHIVQLTTTLTAFDGRVRTVPSLGCLNPDQLRFAPAPRPLPEAERLAFIEAWRAWSAPSPELLLRFLDRPQPNVPLRNAMASLLDRYPSAASGLGRWDERLLAALRQYSSPAAAVGFALIALVDEDGVDDSGDVWLFSRVRRLADPNLSSPLIELDRLETLRRSQTARLTEAGKDVLEGRANAIELNGIDDWVGGTYLDSSRGEVWVRTSDGLERQRDLS